MKSNKRKKIPYNITLQSRLNELEEKAAQLGIHIHYDRLEAAGLKLKGGICRVDGEYHLFVDRRKSTAEKINSLLDFLNHPLPKDIPRIDEKQLSQIPQETP
ncbi:MAG TPA: hypothetical protein PK874_07205 [Desulfobacteraceae bacterium]|nr:hypothetical protein [Desulfobacteraceae bacterium]HPJ66786.1 hypothetical protein [Desulfobacteraceae bacterium]HPQ26996.1 hypothetical protein [Desulfobacteraceae bacterium]